MARQGPHPSQLATAARMLQEHSTHADIATALGVGVSSLRRWISQGLLDDIDAPAAGADALRALVLKASLSDRDRISAASALARIESLDRDMSAEQDERPINIVLPDWHPTAIPLDLCCDDCRAAQDERLEALRLANVPPKSCRQPPLHAHLVQRADPNRVGKWIETRACGCRTTEEVAAEIRSAAEPLPAGQPEPEERILRTRDAATAPQP